MRITLTVNTIKVANVKVAYVYSYVFYFYVHIMVIYFLITYIVVSKCKIILQIKVICDSKIIYFFNFTYKYVYNISKSIVIMDATNCDRCYRKVFIIYISSYCTYVVYFWPSVLIHRF